MPIYRCLVTQLCQCTGFIAQVCYCNGVLLHRYPSAQMSWCTAELVHMFVYMCVSVIALVYKCVPVQLDWLTCVSV